MLMVAVHLIQDKEFVASNYIFEQLMICPVIVLVFPISEVNNSCILG